MKKPHPMVDVSNCKRSIPTYTVLLPRFVNALPTESALEGLNRRVTVGTDPGQKAIIKDSSTRIRTFGATKLLFKFPCREYMTFARSLKTGYVR